jgi:Flp pilus assembly protein CpaB
MRIYGAGLAGLLAANMLRRYKPEVHEAQPSLPNNHEALLRFRSDAVARATGIPFRKVLVHKAILYRGQLITTPNLRLSNMYSQKVTGEVTNRSILSLDSAERFIAPPNLIELLANSVGPPVQLSFAICVEWTDVVAGF